jgi:uncharacterized protein (DUF1501 family)
MHDPLKHLPEASRRAFLIRAAQTALGISGMAMFGSSLLASDTLAAVGAGVGARRPTAKNCIYIFLDGGMSHLDTFDPKPGSDSQGPTKAIATKADGIQIAEYLPKLAQRMNRIALIRGMNSTQGAHQPGEYLMRTSYAMRGTIRHPAMGAWLTYLGGRVNTTLPANVVIGAGSQHPGAGFLESMYAPLPLGNPAAGLQHSTLPAGVDQQHFDRRMALSTQLSQGFNKEYDQKQVRAYHDLYAEAVRLMGSKDLKAFDISQESEPVKQAYGEEQFGQGCLLARRLIENDVRFVEVNLGGWDTHDDNFDRVAARCALLDQGLSALLSDLESRGMLDETLVAVVTEFGRTPKINGNNGRDHYPKAFSCLLAGGGIQGGQVHGATDEHGAVVVSDAVQIPDFNATIGYALGLPLEKVTMSPQGRPFTLANHGRPMTNLF